MFETGILAGLIAKLAGLGAVAKTAIATATAALTMTVAGGAAGVLPLPGGDTGPAAVKGVAGQVVTAVDETTTTSSGDADLQAGAEATVAPPAASASIGADAAAASADAPTTDTPVSSAAGLIPDATLPDLSGLADVPERVMACLDPVLDLVTRPTAVSPGQLSGIDSTIVACVTGIVEGLPLPFGMNACVSQVMGFVGAMTSFSGGIPNMGGFDVAACIPAGLPVPNVGAGFPFLGGGFPFPPR